MLQLRGRRDAQILRAEDRLAERREERRRRNAQNAGRRAPEEVQLLVRPSCSVVGRAGRSRNRGESEGKAREVHENIVNF
jgi:hypothetical protein